MRPSELLLGGFFEYDIDGAVAHLGGWFDERLRETKKQRVLKDGKWVVRQAPKYTAKQAIAMLDRAAAKAFGTDCEAEADREAEAAQEARQYADPSTLLAMGVVRT